MTLPLQAAVLDACMPGHYLQAKKLIERHSIAQAK